MPRPTIDLEPYKAQIIELYQNNNSSADIASFLWQNFEVKVGERTIKRRLQTWEQRKRHVTNDTPELQLRITSLFVECCLKNDDILEVLKAEGYQAVKDRVVRIRKELGRQRRIVSGDRLTADTILRTLVQQELEKGTI